MNDSNQQTKRGRHVCIGTGICHTHHTTPTSRAYLQRADVVFGVMANIGHLTIGLARKEGFFARMEPGVSAEDRLPAGRAVEFRIDPGHPAREAGRIRMDMLPKCGLSEADVSWMMG